MEKFLKYQTATENDGIQNSLSRLNVGTQHISRPVNALGK